jgi:predicted RNase H-like nuclease (RuvC/YqgF family)
VSNPEDRRGKADPDVQALESLGDSVDRAVARLRDLRSQLDEARAEGTEMKELLRQFTQGEEDPSRLLSQLRGLEEENQELLLRLQMGREGVERLLARIRFLEEQS